MDMKKILQVLSEGTMAGAEKHEQGPEFTGYWKGTDKETPGKKMVGGESIIPALAKQAKADTVKNKLVKEFEQFKESDVKVSSVSATTPIQKTQVQPKQTVHVPQEPKATPAAVIDIKSKNELDEFAPPTPELEEDSELHFKNTNPRDVIQVDVPLLIRLLEYAREDAKTDIDLHNVAERLIELSAEGNVLSMDQYDAICGQAQESNTLDEDSGSRDGIIGALTRRIMYQHQEALLKYGPQRMLDAISAEADAIGDVEELGSSDVSIAVDNVLNSLRLEDTVEDPLMKQPVPEEQLTELGADNPQMASTQTTPTTQTTADPKKAAEIVQTNKNLQALKPALAATGVNIDVNKMTQTMAKTDVPGTKLTGTEQQVASQLAPGIADALKNQQAAQLLKQAIQKGQQAQ